MREATEGMLANYLELKQISLIMAKSDAPGWVGSNLTVEDDIHVIKVRKALCRECQRLLDAERYQKRIARAELEKAK